MVLGSGTIIDGYEVLSLLGAGGMGEVYRARDSRLGRDVAIKVLPGFASADPEHLRRFELEARAAAALNHPNILVVHQMGSHDGAPYLVSEFLEGESLRERLRKGPLALREVIDYGTQIARGLAAAHEKGIVHRDLKPENLIITKDGQVKILDFGLARMIQQKPAMTEDAQTLVVNTQPGTVMGSPGYMSPEQVRGEPADHRTDLFTFAAILQEMITGKRVFERPTSVETMTAILKDDPAPIAQLAPVTPPGLQRLVHHGLEKDPERRFHSASDMGFALEALADTSSVATHAAQAQPQPPGTRGRRVAALAAAIAAAAAVAVFAWQRMRAAPAPMVSNYVQLTHDGLQKQLIGTDGSRIYLTLMSAGVQRVAVMQATGGEETLIPMLAPGMAPVDMAPDGSALLVVDGKGFPTVGPFWAVPVLGGSPERLGESVGNTAAWSADGKMLAYVDRGNLYVARADGTEPRRILTVDSLISDVAWSPKGDYLRFGVSNFSQTAVGTAAIGQQAIWQVAADGSKLHPLLAGQETPDECCGRWTADGRYFVFQSKGQIWVLPEGGFLHSKARPVQITASPMPLTSPLPSKDGTKLFVVGRTYRGELTRFDVKSGHAEPYLGGISAEWLDFSKDGQWVTYVSYPEGNLWKSKVDGSDRVQLTFPPVQPVLPRWSPDGQSILYFEFPVKSGEPGRAFLISSSGGAPRPLMPDDPHSQQDTTWSPDGTRIAFAGAANDAAVGNAASGIRVLNLANHQISLIPGSQKLFSPRWSPDGRYLAAMPSDSSALLLFDFQTQRWTELARGTFGWPNWAADGKSIYVMDSGGNGGVDSIRVSDHSIERVVDLSNFSLTGQGGGSLSELPDGSPLLLRDRGTQDVYALDWHE